MDKFSFSMGIAWLDHWIVYLLDCSLAFWLEYEAGLLEFTEAELTKLDQSAHGELLLMVELFYEMSHRPY